MPAITAVELRLEAARKEGNRFMEKQKLEHLEQEKQMAIKKAKFNKEMEEKQNWRLNYMQKLVSYLEC